MKITAFLFVGGALAWGLGVLDTVRNSWRLKQIENSIAGMPTPPLTVCVSRRSAVGQLSGSGNHCDYFAGAIFRSDSPPEVVRKRYQGQTILNPVTGAYEELELTFLTDPASLEEDWLPYAYDHLEAWRLSADDLKLGTVYLLHFMGRTHPIRIAAATDWRLLLITRPV